MPDKLQRLVRIADASWRLGPANVARIAAYRAGLKSGYWRWRMPTEPASEPAPLFAARPSPRPAVAADVAVTVERAAALSRGEHVLFSRHRVQAGSPPDWTMNPLNGSRVAAPERHWSQIPDFDPVLGDVKCVWETSRFAFAQTLAAAEAAVGDGRHLALLEAWVADWRRRNLVNAGPNWKCAQEASLRCLSVVLAADLLGALERPTPSLTALLFAHARRIEPTMLYAVAQDNNHGTSEAVGLYVIGAVLLRSADRNEREAGRRLVADGLARLEERVLRLVLPDGTFSQYSIVYQRLLIDTAVVGEVVRRRLGLPAWPAPLTSRLARAVDWLAAMTDEATGEAPNLGANDGAMLFALGPARFRDFRPTVQLGSILFAGHRRYGPGDWDHLARWLAVEPLDMPVVARREIIRHARDGGFIVVRCGETQVVMRTPTFRFRPSQADVMHLDVRHRGRTVLCDGGTFSYAVAPAMAARYGGAEGHNQVSFDGESQMPPVGRFLYAHWLSGPSTVRLLADPSRGETVRIEAAYRDWRGRRHARIADVSEGSIQVRDRIDGPFRTAELRWRCAGGDRLSVTATGPDGARVRAVRGGAGEPISIDVTAAGPVTARIESGHASMYYLDAERVPTLVVSAGPEVKEFLTCIELEAEAEPGVVGSGAQALSDETVIDRPASPAVPVGCGSV